MSQWLKERAAASRAFQEEQRIIKQGIDELWAALQQSAMAVAKEYAEEFPESVEPYDFIQTQPNGFEKFAVEVLEGMIGQRGHRSPKAKVTVTLHRDAAKVTALYTMPGSQQVELRVGVSRNNSACFFIRDKEISLEEATELIMAPVLFRDITKI